MPARCDQCGKEEYMPYACKFCQGRHCAAHRLPENHGCQGLDAYRAKAREEGKLYRPPPETVAPEMSPRARAGMSLDALWSRLDGKMTYAFIGLSVAIYVLQWIVALNSITLHNLLFTIDGQFFLEPWTILTNIFAHSLASPMHLFINMLVLFFFGTTTERLIGTRRFTYLFLGAGVLAGIAQVVLTNYLFGLDNGALGASGAIQGVLGTLVVLAPRLTVLVFGIIPAPLWALTIFYVLFDIMGSFNPGSGVGHFAHLAGFAVGFLYGQSLKQQGLRVRTAPPGFTMRRHM